MSDFAIETRGLTRYYGQRCVVAPLDLEVPRGSIFGFLGRNGAGKSTTIRMMLGLVEPTRGSATVLGHDSMNLAPNVRARIGYLAEGHHVYEWMSVRECGQWQSRFYPHWNEALYQGVLEHFRLKSNTLAKDLSRGERAGLCLAMTLAPEPELLILDDPALGLDPVARRSLIQSMLYVARAAERTIFFSSHLLSDVERVADRIAVLDGGVLRANCTVETFRDRVRRVALHFTGAAPPLPPIPGLLHSFRTRDEIVLTLANSDAETDRVLLSLSATRIETVPMGLEDAFIDYLGERGDKSFFVEDLDGKAEANA